MVVEQRNKVQMDGRRRLDKEHMQSSQSFSKLIHMLAVGAIFLVTQTVSVTWFLAGMYTEIKLLKASLEEINIRAPQDVAGQIEVLKFRITALDERQTTALTVALERMHKRLDEQLIRCN